MHFKNPPKHLAIIMDGNGRWANNRALPRKEGHRAGEKTLLEIVRASIDAGIKALSIYAFSTENWNRDISEVRFLMGFNREVLYRNRDLLNSWGVKIIWSGSRRRLYKNVIKDLDDAVRLTKNNTGLILNMCVNYGGRDDILQACNRAVTNGKKITKKSFESLLYSAPLYKEGIGDVDLLIRSSPETRVSNFLLWNIAYAEMVFMPVLWPDFTKQDLYEAIKIYESRNRRFGKAKDIVADKIK